MWPEQQYSYRESNKDTPPETKIEGNKPAIPCGLVAKSFFTDKFVLYKKNSDGTREKINIDKDNIAWTSDVDYKFKNIVQNIPADRTGPDGSPATWEDIQWLDMTDPDFIVWMRTAGLPNFRKLWGRIDKPLEPGEYELEVDNRYDVNPFSGRKSFVISTTNALGGKNYFLAVCYITVGTFCLLFSFVFCGAYMKKRNNNNFNQNQGV